MKSSLMLNVTMSKTQRRRGRYVLKSYRDLKAQYGGALAKDIRLRKKELGPPWWQEHPDLPGVEDT